MCSVCWCEAPGGDVAACVHAGKDGFLGDCVMLDLTACVVCRSVVGERLGREDAQVCNLLRSEEGLGWGDRCWDGRSYSLCMKRNAYVGIW
jgi:hypothetical protein